MEEDAMATRSVGEAAPELREVELTPAERDELVTKKVTCPFLGSAVATRQLTVRNEPANPLASVQEVIDLGNSGGGDLGRVLGFFARGNHGKMHGPSGKLDTPVPPGFFSLDLPGSQGSHPGHSGILQGDPTQLDSGRFSGDDLRRLEDMSHDGFIKRSDIALFIAENLRRDPRSRLFPLALWVREAVDLTRDVLLNLAHPAADRTEGEIQTLARLAGSNNLVGSAGEFGLLLAFLHNSPRTRHDGGDPAFSMAEISAMFRDKKLPDDFQTWRKTARDWIVHTVELAGGAAATLTKASVVQGLGLGAR
jgi:hypothetical protein